MTRVIKRSSTKWFLLCFSAPGFCYSHFPIIELLVFLLKNEYIAHKHAEEKAPRFVVVFNNSHGLECKILVGVSNLEFLVIKIRSSG